MITSTSLTHFYFWIRESCRRKLNNHGKLPQSVISVKFKVETTWSDLLSNDAPRFPLWKSGYVVLRIFSDEDIAPEIGGHLACPCRAIKRSLSEPHPYRWLHFACPLLENHVFSVRALFSSSDFVVVLFCQSFDICDSFDSDPMLF
jgi:hypothetical protein